ncbi:MAG: 4Fe-4S binding protein [Deltaproteobacteria bacterium]|nr:MAG: 4Fe-4S binding protein [Deltaproteobacteria bacterium]
MRARQLVWIRRISQTFFLLFFLFLLVESRLPRDVFVDYSVVFSAEPDLAIDYPVGFFFQLDPLVWLSSLISGHQLIKGFWWALVLLAVTLFMGRIFCGFVCPLGTLHHAVSWFRPSLKADAMIRANEKASSQKIKYFLLITVLVGAVLGLNMVGLMDPLSVFFRSLALALFPGAAMGLREFSEVIANSDSTALRLLSYGGEVIAQFLFGFGYKAYTTAWFIGIIFLGIVFLNRIRPRFWCRVLCPLGALLGICSRLSILRLEKDRAKCTDCELCAKSCQGAASPKPGNDWENAECLMCFNCFDSCPASALFFRFRWSSLRLNRGPDMGRRALLAGLVGGISLPLFGRLDGRVHKVADPRLIRPPGALPEKDFLTLCQRCGLCMKACPTNVINPTLTEAGMAGFWTPHLIMTQGYCEYTCTLCGDVCPTGAIRVFSAKEKIETPIVIGSAYIDRGRCLPWSGNGPCIVCEEHCPTSPKAIFFHKDMVPGPNGKQQMAQLPHVDLRKCVGCGICEFKCPVKGRPAIRVISAGESRSLENQILL